MMKTKMEERSQKDLKYQNKKEPSPKDLGYQSKQIPNSVQNSPKWCHLDQTM